jgi:tetratricopeptide (TPR) repeat protein
VEAGEENLRHAPGAEQPEDLVSAYVPGEVIHAVSRLEAMRTPEPPMTLPRTGGFPSPRVALRRISARLGSGFLAAVCVLAPPAGALAAPPDEDQERAIELFRASQRSYEAGRFGEAAVYLEEAYRLDPAPILLYNLARARESEGDLELAVEAYRRYLREAPDAEDRPAVEARIAAIERQIAERARLEEMVEAERRARAEAAAEAEQARLEARARASAPEGAGPGLAPWVVAGAGGAGLAVGGVLGVLAADRHGAAESEPTQARAAELADEADGLALGANIAYAAGGALAAGGLLWALLAPRGERGAEATLSFGPGGVAVAGRF